MAKVSSVLALWLVWDNRPSARRTVCWDVAGYLYSGPTEFFRVALTLAAAAPASEDQCQRPASAVVDQIDVNMIESKRERQPNPEDTRGNLS
jgi:hypothetical protein